MLDLSRNSLSESNLMYTVCSGAGSLTTASSALRDLTGSFPFSCSDAPPSQPPWRLQRPGARYSYNRLNLNREAERTRLPSPYLVLTLPPSPPPVPLSLGARPFTQPPRPHRGTRRVTEAENVTTCTQPNWKTGRA